MTTRWQRTWTVGALGALVLGTLATATSVQARTATAGEAEAPPGVYQGRVSPLAGPLPGTAAHRREARHTAAEWQKLPALPVARFFHTAVFGDGKLYVAGGQGAGMVPPSERSGGRTAADPGLLHAYDPGTEKWTRLADMPEQLDRMSAAWIDGKLYTAGGWQTSDAISSQTYVYDPDAHTWDTAAEMPGPNGGAGTAVVGSKMYVVGGCEPGGGLCGSQDVTVFDAADGTWSEAPDYPEPVSDLSCGGIDDLVYCAGGAVDGGREGTNATYVLDGTEWKKLADMPDRVSDAGYAVVDGKLLVSGGVSHPGRDEAEVTGAGWSYDPASDAWAELPGAQHEYIGLAGAAGPDGFYRVAGTTGLMNDPDDDVELLPADKTK